VVRRLALALAALALGASAAWADEPATYTINRLPTSLAGEWLFHIGHDPSYSSPFRERRNWQGIKVPGAWQKQGWPNYNGHAWYRVLLFISSDLAGEDFGIDLGRVGDADEAFLNGRKIGGTGGFPPHFDKATLARRFYLVPREVLRLGQLNELAVHIYGDSRSSGLLGPAPELNRGQAILGRQVLRDLGAYCVATLLVTLAILHLLLFASQRDLFEHLALAGCLASAGCYVLTYASWGPAHVLGNSGAFRLNVVALLATVALFPVVPYRLARRRQPAALLGLETLLALGAVFAIVWREESDLQLWVYAAQAALLLVAVLTVRQEVGMLRRQRRWAGTLLVASALFFALVALDVLVDIGVLPRTQLIIGELFTPLGLVPFALVLSVVLGFNWVERRWGEPLDPTTGLMPRERFNDRLSGELQRVRRTGSQLAVALLRLTVPDEAGEREKLTADAVAGLRRALRQIDLLARYDRETLVLLLAETEERAAMAIIERLRRAAGESASSPTTRVRTTAGLAQYRPGRHLGAEELLQEAEAALYAAISEGGDCTATAP
jgi:diguanylate cyclase (GGDEF)-like protein